MVSHPALPWPVETRSLVAASNARQRMPDDRVLRCDTGAMSAIRAQTIVSSMPAIKSKREHSCFAS